VTAVIGTGSMAESIIRGLAGKRELAVAGRDKRRLAELAERYGVRTAKIDGFGIEGADVILAVKPHALADVAKRVRGRAATLHSVLAGTPLAALREALSAERYIRAMPNIAAAHGASVTALTGDEAARERAEELFGAIGETLWLDSEAKLDAATAIAGSGPAFLALVAEALADGGVACGLSRDEAAALTAGLFRSYAALADEPPAKVKDRVMSPAGTTAAGYGALEERGVRGAFIEAVKRAFERTKR